MTTNEQIRATAEAWRAADPDPDTVRELAELLGRPDGQAQIELRDRFAVRLDFGTAGLRGLLGAGTNRMNRAIVIQTSAGLARYLLDQIPDAARRGVVVAYDGRHKSLEFAEDTAEVLSAAGITVHLFRRVAPTPLAAFTVGELGAVSGVMVTASHNPARYNGYKVYWENAAQIIPPHDTGIAAAIAAIGAANQVPRLDLAEARRRGLVRDVPEAIINAYLSRVFSFLPHPEVRPEMPIVYTAMHGVGGDLAIRAFARAGFSNLHVVSEQIEPDPDFPTVAFPNPEEKGAMDLSLALAQRTNAEVVLANDPDADRLAVAVPALGGNGTNSFVQLTGNQVGVMLGAYLLGEEPGEVGQARPTSKKRRAVVESLVSSPMLGEIAHALGVHYEETLTGFKWIANRAIALAAEGIEFVFGYEEALGYSVGDVVRDKDGVGAAVLFAELVGVCRARRLTVLSYLESLYRRYGLYLSGQKSLTREGVEGIAAIDRIMQELRASPPANIAGRRVTASSDLQSLERRTADGRNEKIALPSSNVLVYELEGGGRIIVRPSGTEPKIKYYFDHREPVATSEPLADAEARGRQAMAAMAKAIVPGG
jgi:phosphomannomutase